MFLPYKIIDLTHELNEHNTTWGMVIVALNYIR